ncbi:hypothetical protein D3C77_761710 [compost metagenome]
MVISLPLHLCPSQVVSCIGITPLVAEAIAIALFLLRLAMVLLGWLFAWDVP